MAETSTALTTKVASGSPYQLDPSQVSKASGALLKHVKSAAQAKKAASQTKNLLAADDDSSGENDPADVEPIWMIMTTKKHIVDQKRLKPGKIPLPHSLNNTETTTICLVTVVPQRSYKDAIAQPTFPTSLSSKITRVIDITHLKARCKSFEERRQLLNEHDVFLADDRVITLLPQILGKTFYSGSKRPIPVDLQAYREKGPDGKRVKATKDPQTRSIAPPAKLAKEIERCLGCAQVHLSPAATTAIRVGLSSFSTEQLAANIEAVVKGMEEKFVTKGWRNIRAVHIKGNHTMAIPVWLANELWVEETDILEAEEEKEAIILASQAGRKRKSRENEEDAKEKKIPKKIEDSDLGEEMAARREKLRQAKKEAREQVEGKAVINNDTTAKGTEGGKVKVKTKKHKATIALS